MGPTGTGRDFEKLSFHDNHLYGLRFDAGDPEAGTWHSNLVFDIDHIVEWICSPAPGQSRFRVAPATLTFHHVTDLRLDVQWPRTDHQANISEPSMDAVERTPLRNQKICLDRPYFKWCIRLNSPAGGLIRFGASHLELELRAEAVLVAEQKLSGLQRAEILAKTS